MSCALSVVKNEWNSRLTLFGPASLQNTLFSNSCLLMTWGDWHLHNTPIRTEQQGCLRAEVDPPGSVDQSDLSSEDSIIRFGKSGRRPGILFSRSWLRFRCKKKRKPAVAVENNSVALDCWFSIKTAMIHGWVDKHVFQSKRQTGCSFQLGGLHYGKVSRKKPLSPRFRSFGNGLVLGA